MQQLTVCPSLSCRSLLSLRLMSRFTVCCLHCLCQCAFCLFPCLLWVCGFGLVEMVADGGRLRVAGAWCVCLCVCLFVCLLVCWLCGAVSCRVSRVVARYFLSVVRHSSSVVDCLSLCCALLLCVAVSGCVLLGRGRGGRGVCIERVSVCTFKTFPCVPAPRPHVSYIWVWCWYTRGRCERTHVFFFFSACHTKHHTKPHHTAHTHTPQPQPQHSHSDNDTQRHTTNQLAA